MGRAVAHIFIVDSGIHTAHEDLVDRVDTDPKVRSLVVAIVEMAGALGAAAVAEGIERSSQLAVLRDLGCPLGQGFHLGRPAPADAVDLAPRIVA